MTLRHYVRITPLVLLMIVIASSARAQREPRPPRAACTSSVCETAIGPVTLVPAVQKARLTVNNVANVDAMVVMVFVNGLTSEVLSQSTVVLTPHQGHVFDYAPGPPSPPEIQLVAGLRVSRTQRAKEADVGATLQLIDTDTRKTSLFVQLPTPTNSAANVTWSSASQSPVSGDPWQAFAPVTR